MNKKEKLIQKLFANQCSEKELRMLFDLIQEDEATTAPEVMTTLLHQMEEVPNLKSDTSNRILGKVLKETIEKEKTISPRVIPMKSKRTNFWMLKTAAAILFLVSMTWIIYQFNRSSSVIIQTGFNEQKEIMLPDGSKVTLNGKSKLEYESDWSADETRVVHLDGEAYFKVNKKPTTNAKFQVITEDLTVEVLGTVFNVNTRKDATKVFLEEGKVKLNLEDQQSSELLLEPGQVASYSAKKRLLSKPEMAVKVVETSWKDGFLTFRDTGLKEILEKLAATADFEFEMDSLIEMDRKFNIAVPNNDVEKAMNLLQKTTGLDIQEKEGRYIFNQFNKEE
ncbi:MAG: FecR domain-containing protein [Bacteroidota bacterium]